MLMRFLLALRLALAGAVGFGDRRRLALLPSICVPALSNVCSVMRRVPECHLW